MSNQQHSISFDNFFLSIVIVSIVTGGMIVLDKSSSLFGIRAPYKDPYFEFRNRSELALIEQANSRFSITDINMSQTNIDTLRASTKPIVTSQGDRYERNVMVKNRLEGQLLTGFDSAAVAQESELPVGLEKINAYYTQTMAF